MKKLVAVLILGLLTLVGCAERRNSASSGGAAATGHATGAKAESIDRLNDSAQVLKELTNAPDNGIPNEVLAKAKCVAVVPSMIKGGFVFGGQHGRGVATCRTNNGWSAPAFFTMTGGSWGAQIGAEAVDVVMLVMNDQGMKDLLSSKFKLGAAASVAAGPVGREATANTDLSMKSGILTYSRARGLFAGLDLNGAVVQQDDESQDAFYGKDVTFGRVLQGGVSTPADAQPFLASVRESFHEARHQDAAERP
ncbi:MAG: lipid-binding SYLF domain-containing protein [Candidatus Koribacter versatilis]|uniref:Lipid-binding SYLF domain-containing protein n=1 Tax=Candidatus Korobacter versatilis TaxID=658062 RepID=A0A932A9D0_9BACT|nr:lipid-binding SYLF domain-containing protein [Candidatus Koribacter versatilis]